MFFAAVAHKYSFSHKPFHINIPHYENNQSFFNSFVAMWDISDIQQDVTEHIGVMGSSLTRRFRGRTAYSMARGTTTEADYLITHSTQSPLCYQSGLPYSGNYNSMSNVAQSSSKNRYGAVDDETTQKNYQMPPPNDGINIVKQSLANKEYSPQFGAPKTDNYFKPNQPPTNSSNTSSSLMNKSNSDNTGSTTTTSNDKSETFTGLGTATSMKKSDSNASDWLSTPTEEMLGIDVKGLEKDKINYNPNA